MMLMERCTGWNGVEGLFEVSLPNANPFAVRERGGQGGVDVSAAQLEGRRADAGLRRDGDDVGQGGQRGLRGTPEGAGRLHQEPAEQRQVL